MTPKPTTIHSTPRKGLLPNLSEPEPEYTEDCIVRVAVRTALTEKQREAVELFFFEGLSQSDIARRLGISQQVVQKRLFGAPRGGTVVGGALAKLREALRPHLGTLGVRA